MPGLFFCGMREEARSGTNWLPALCTASCILLPVHCRIRGAHQAVFAVGIFGEEGDADACRPLDLAAIKSKGLVEAVFQPLRDLFYFGPESDSGDNDCKLIAAEARQRIAGSAIAASCVAKLPADRNLQLDARKDHSPA